MNDPAALVITVLIGVATGLAATRFDRWLDQWSGKRRLASQARREEDEKLVAFYAAHPEDLTHYLLRNLSAVAAFGFLATMMIALPVEPIPDPSTVAANSPLTMSGALRLASLAGSGLAATSGVLLVARSLGISARVRRRRRKALGFVDSDPSDAK